MRYRKKPVVIDAFHVTEHEYHTYVCCGAFANAPEWINLTRNLKTSNGAIYVNTLEGEMRVRPRDYIIRGVDGEFYPCKESIFLETYELVNEDDN